MHVSLVGEDRMRISWITDDQAPPIIEYGTASGTYEFSGNGTTSSYKYILYKSGQIHDVVIGPLKPNTTYYYRCSTDSAREFSFKTPPAQFPVIFSVAGM